MQKKEEKYVERVNNVIECTDYIKIYPFIYKENRNTFWSVVVNFRIFFLKKFEKNNGYFKVDVDQMMLKCTKGTAQKWSDEEIVS